MLKMVLKKIGKVIITILSIIIILFLLLSVLINYFAGLNGKVRNGENFCKDKQYAIGKAYNNNEIYFCDNKEKSKCINWIKGYTLSENKDLYMSFDSLGIVGKTEQEINEILKVENPKGYMYSIFLNDYKTKYYAKTYDEIIRFLKVNYDTCELKFYNSLDIESLTDTEKSIFRGLTE